MKIATILGLSLVGISILPAFAEAPQYDRSIEKAAEKQVANKIGALRGVIVESDANLFVTLDDVKPAPKKEKIKFTQQEFETQNKSYKLKPMVMGKVIDPVITGAPYKSNLATKFDGNGNPLAHHHDQPSQSFFDVARDMLDSLELNPYPGGK